MPSNSGHVLRDGVLREDDDDEEEELNEDGVPWFYVNHSGFPVNEATWERMWDHIIKTHPEGKRAVDKIRNAKELPDQPVPQAPVWFPISTSIETRLEAVQDYMKELQYNHTGTQFFAIRKHRPLSGLMDTAKEMTKESLPIKCLEAVILGTYLTNGFSGVDRFPISFKSSFYGHTHRHVVLGLCYKGIYGALGMSRRSDLMDKPLAFKSLSDLVGDYEAAYKRYWHEVRKVVIGKVISQETHSHEPICWRYLILKVNKIKPEEKKFELDKYAKEMRYQSSASQVAVAVSGVSPKKTTGSFSTKNERKKFTRTKGVRRSSKIFAPQQNTSDDGNRSSDLDDDFTAEEDRNNFDIQDTSADCTQQHIHTTGGNYSVRI